MIKKTKGKSTIFKSAAVAVMALMLASGSILPALSQATESESSPPPKSLRAAITKSLKMSDGLETPDLTFSFEFTSVSVDNVPATDQNMPKIPDKTVTFTSADAGISEDGVKIVNKESENLFADAPWKHAGVYVYTVKEAQSVKETLSSDESITYSQAEYKLAVFVANGDDGLYAAYVMTEVNAVDSADEDTKPGDKIDVTPGGPPDGSFSQMVFTNTYFLNTGGKGPEDPALAISKTVKSDDPNHDVADRGMLFDFEVTVTKSNLNTNADQKYKAYVMSGKTDVVTDEENFAGTIQSNEYGKYIEFTSGVQQTVKLKHGQWLSFIDLEVGASYKVTEVGKANYTPECDQLINGTLTKIPGTQNTSLAVGETGITSGEDRADFINTYKTVSPVGVSVDNLPYVIFIGLILTALAGFIIIKSRREKETKKTADPAEE